MDSAKVSNGLDAREQKDSFLYQKVLLPLIAAAILFVIITALLLGPPEEKHYPEEMTKSKESPGTNESPMRNIRLPRSIAPKHYDIELQPYITEDNFTFDGKVRIVIKVLESTDNVTLHVRELRIDAESVKLTDARTRIEQDIVSHTEDAEIDFYILNLKRNLTKGAQYELYMEYVGNITEWIGFYRCAYIDEDGNNRWWAVSKFEPTYAREAVPCFDEPALKATFNITLVRRRNMTSLSNMPRYKTEDRGDEWVADYFKKTVRMSTYLMAFIFGDFKSIGTPKFSVWSRPNALNTTQYALDVGSRMFDFFASYFNVPYTLPKLDMVAVPEFPSGAMENWGLIMYKENRMLYDDNHSMAKDKQSVAEIIAHELSHQWFGNLVTMAWWDNIWLNEGFATYMKYIGVNAVQPNWNVEEQFVISQTQQIMDRDCFNRINPLSQPVTSPHSIFRMFSGITYSKGAAMVRMMKYFLGEKIFIKGLTNYLKAKKFDNANQDDLFEHLTTIQSRDDRIDVKVVMDSWTLQSGYPVVEVIRNYASDTAEVNQYQYMVTKDNNTVYTNYTYEIPFTYTDSLNPDWTPNTRLWLHKINGTISGLPSSHHWIIGNLQEVGYYKVNYDEHNWKLIIEQLLEDHTKIHTINRAQIIDDALDFAEADRLNYVLALNVTKYLKNEKEYAPWKPALDRFSYIHSMICRTPIYGMWRKHLKNLLKSLYESLGWEQSPDENIQKTYMRLNTLTWMCKVHYKDCIEKAQAKFEEWKHDPSNPRIIPPDLRRLVLCTAVEHGGEEAFDFLWERFKTVQMYSEQKEFLNALGCAREPWLITRYLNWSLTFDPVKAKKQEWLDARYVFKTVGSQFYGRDIMFNYIRDKWDIIKDSIGKSGTIPHVVSSFNTQYELSQMKEFYLSKNLDYYRYTEEDVVKNIRWMDKRYRYIMDWLKVVVSN